MTSTTLYTRAGCHLCDEARAVLLRHGLQPELIDIDRDPELIARYGNCVPVVVIDGRFRFRGRVDERLLRRLLRPTSWWQRLAGVFRRIRPG
jgi:glutaredoxin